MFLQDRGLQVAIPYSPGTEEFSTADATNIFTISFAIIDEIGDTGSGQPAPDAASGDIVVRTLAAALNPVDYTQGSLGWPLNAKVGFNAHLWGGGREGGKVEGTERDS